MGCCQSISLKEKKILSKENALEINRVNITELKKAFQLPDEYEALTFEKIIKSLKMININLSESIIETIFKPFLRSFTKESIKVQYEEEYDYKNLISIFFLLSKSNEYEKAIGLFDLYDVGKNETMSKYELEYLLTKIFVNVDSYSEIFYFNLPKFNENNENQEDLYQKQKELDHIKSTLINDIVNELMNFFFLSENIRSIERDKFYYKVQDAKQSLKMDIISTSGIRKILEKFGARMDVNDRTERLLNLSSQLNQENNNL